MGCMYCQSCHDVLRPNPNATTSSTCCKACGHWLSNHKFFTVEQMEVALQMPNVISYKSEIRVQRFYQDIVEQVKCAAVGCNAEFDKESFANVIKHIETTGHEVAYKTATWQKLQISSNPNLATLQEFSRFSPLNQSVDDESSQITVLRRSTSN